MEKRRPIKSPAVPLGENTLPRMNSREFWAFTFGIDEYSLLAQAVLSHL